MENSTVIAAVAAYVSKDVITRLLGPTAEYLGEGLKNLAQRRVETIGEILRNAKEKSGPRLEQSGEVPPKVLEKVLSEGSYSTDGLAVEYLGGLLASSRTETGRDDRAARMAKLVNELSTYQLRTHYLLYTTIRQVFNELGDRFSIEANSHALQIYVRFEDYLPVMELNSDESSSPQLIPHIFNGLSKDGLIAEDWVYGSPEHIRRTKYLKARDAGFVCYPSPIGAELFLWAFGHSDKPLEYIFDQSFDPTVEGVGPFIPNAVATST